MAALESREPKTMVAAESFWESVMVLYQARGWDRASGGRRGVG